MKGLFFQGYKCVRCACHAHRECISQLHRCGTVVVQPPELPPRPPLLPIANPSRIPDSQVSEFRYEEVKNKYNVLSAKVRNKTKKHYVDFHDLI